jgi:hypothetical protein
MFGYEGLVQGEWKNLKTLLINNHKTKIKGYSDSSICLSYLMTANFKKCLPRFHMINKIMDNDISKILKDKKI